MNVRRNYEKRLTVPLCKYNGAHAYELIANGYNVRDTFAKTVTSDQEEGSWK